jgi:hypothetical protein
MIRKGGIRFSEQTMLKRQSRLGRGFMVQRWGGRTETWPPGGARPRALAGPRYFADATPALLDWLRRCARAEAIPGRLLPWLPVAFGFGIAIYFAAEH